MTHAYKAIFESIWTFDIPAREIHEVDVLDRCVVAEMHHKLARVTDKTQYWKRQGRAAALQVQLWLAEAPDYGILAACCPPSPGQNLADRPLKSKVKREKVER